MDAPISRSLLRERGISPRGIIYFVEESFCPPINVELIPRRWMSFASFARVAAATFRNLMLVVVLKKKKKNSWKQLRSS